MRASNSRKIAAFFNFVRHFDLYECRYFVPALRSECFWGHGFNVTFTLLSPASTRSMPC
jgi:hypothetical protein